MSFSEFYQRSINEPEQFWAEQAQRIDWQTPFTQTLNHGDPPFTVGFVKAEPTSVTTLSTAGWRTARGAGADCRLFGNRRRAHLYLSSAA
ncbi:acetyl-coenzyme A synthetase N-terminal domain-containing protein [Escherichia coli]